MNTAYRYVAWQRDGRVERSTIGAEDRNDAYRSLRERGFRPISIEERGTIFKIGNWFVQRPVERLSFFRSFAALQEAGTNLEEAFEMVISQAKLAVRRDTNGWIPWIRHQRETFIRSIEGVSREVLTGTKLHDAMARRPEEFSEVEAAMCQIGDEAGTLARVLSQIAEFLERERKFGRQLGDALIYPAMVALAAVTLIAFMLVRLIPQFAGLFQGFNVPLPLTMKVMLHVSKVVATPWFAILFFGGLTMGGLAFARALETPAGALAFDRFRLAIPIVGTLIEKVIVARLARVLAMLFDAGKAPLRAVEICIPVTQSPVFARAMTQARDLLARGQVANVYEALVRTEAFEPLLTGFVKVGVRTGDLPGMLLKVAEYYESDIASLTATIPTVVQTVVTIVMGGVVGVIVYSVYVPLSQLVSQIHQ